MVIIKILVFIACLIVGLLLLKYTEPFVRMVGHNSFAEKYLGSGGTYSFWKIIALLIIIAGLVYLIGW